MTNATPAPRVADDADAVARPDGALLRTIGTWGLAASIVNVTIGGGIFRLPASPEIAGRLGAAAPLAYVACAIVMGLIVLCIAEAGSRVSMTGGPYAYVEVTFGRYVGFLVGVMLWLLGCTAMPAVAGVFADTVARFFPAVGTAAGRALFLAAIFGAVATINVIGVRQGTRLNAVLTVAKLAPLLLLLVAGLFAVSGANFRVTQPVSGGDLSRASVFLIFAFAGVESALMPSGEVRDPARTVPRAVFLAMGLVTLLYIGLQVVAQGVLGDSLVGDATPLATAAGRIFGPWGATMLSLGFIISAFGYLSGMTLAVPRALFAFGRDRILPRQLASVHPRFHTPWIAIIVQSAIGWTLSVTSGFEGLAIIANVSAALVYLGCAAAAWKLRRSSPIGAEGAGMRVPGGAVAPPLAALALLFLLASVTLKEWSVLAAVVVVASLLYFVATRNASARDRAVE
jgi:APA family basic amino acid/polyamine antiporter